MISAVVPIHESAVRLRRNLASLQRALELSGVSWEIVVVLDGRIDDMTVKNGVRVVALSDPLGYGPAVNAGVASAGGDELLVLNDDVRLEDTTVERLREALAPERLFAVVPSIRSPLAACGDEAGKGVRWRAGLMEVEERTAGSGQEAFYPVGCCFLCHRCRFQELGGYDPVYAPYLWEDVDLGLRAWQRGWATRVEPAAICHHEGSATIGQRPMDERVRLWHRNWFLLHLRNVLDPELRGASLGAMAAYALLDGREPVRAGLREALDAFAECGTRVRDGVSERDVLLRFGAL